MPRDSAVGGEGGSRSGVRGVKPVSSRLIASGGFIIILIREAVFHPADFLRILL